MRRLRAPACTATRPERLLRGVIALVLAAVALSTLPTAPVVGVAASIVALGIAAMAITGACPPDGVQRSVQRTPASDDDADARSIVTLIPVDRKGTHSS